MTPPTPPVVLAIGGHDPVGGAGIQADIEAIRAQGCYAATAITCLTVQDTVNVQRVHSVDPELVQQQIETVLADLPVAAIKIGLIGGAEVGCRLGQVLARHSNVPVVLDPVLRAGGGARLNDTDLWRVLLDELLPRTELLTPNTSEARTLTGTEDLDASAQILLEKGARRVLITGGHEQGRMVTNELYGPEGQLGSWEWERLPGEYHGSGCTLASSIAALLARGLDLVDAAREGQEYTWQALAHAYRLGRGQWLPNRLFSLPDTDAP